MTAVPNNGVILYDRTGIPLLVDRDTKTLSSITTDHTYIHEGMAFTHSSLFTLAGEVGAKKEFRFTAPASGKYIHFRPLIFSSVTSAIKISLFREGTYTGGDAVLVWNRNQNSTVTALMAVYSGTITISVAGTLIDVGTIGLGGNAAKASGGSGNGADEEIVLKQGAQYLLRCENLTTTETIATAKLFWYEED